MAEVVRERLKVAGEKVLDHEKLEAALLQAFDASKRYKCEHCDRYNRIPMPDFTQIEKLLNQMYGPMPAPEQVVHHDITVMTLEQRIALANELRARREALQLASGNDEAA